MALFDSLKKVFGGRDDGEKPEPSRAPSSQASPVDAVNNSRLTKDATRAIVARITSQDELKQVAAGAWLNNDARIAALERIDDMAFLAQRAIEDQVVPVKLRAIDLIDDASLLLGIWKRERSTPAWREVAQHAEERARQMIGHIDDQDTLAQFAVCESTACRWAATERVEDKGLLARIALGEADNTDVWTRRTAIARINDRSVLKKVLKTRSPWDDDYKDAEKRLEKLDNPDAGGDDDEW